MFPAFLPSTAAALSEATSITYAQALRQTPVTTELTPDPIATTLAHHHPQEAVDTLPIVLLHGFDSSLMEFRRLVPQLALHHEVWTFDLLGFGFTERPDRLRFSPRAIKHHLWHTWKQLIDQPILLIGVSMGGAAALDFALSFPESVSQLVLMDSAGLTTGPEQVIGPYLIPPLGFLATEFLRNPRIRQQISAGSYYNPAFANDDALIAASLHVQTPGWQRALASFTRSGGYGSFIHDLHTLLCPTLVIWGDSDRILGTRMADIFVERIPDSQLVWIRHCGHVPHLEKPTEVATLISTFARQGLPFAPHPTDPHPTDLHPTDLHPTERGPATER